MTSPKTPPKTLRDRLAAKVAATMLWPVAKARPESEWARMQKRLASLGDEQKGGEAEQNPFVRAAAAASERGADDEEHARRKDERGPAHEAHAADDARGERPSNEAKSAVPSASEDLGAWPPGPGLDGRAPSGASSETAGRAEREEKEAGGEHAEGSGSVSDESGESAREDETEFAAWAREKRGAGREVRGLRQAQSLLFRRGVRPPMALFALLLSVAAAAWLYDFWRKPREPQPAGVSSSSVVRARLLAECPGR